MMSTDKPMWCIDCGDQFTFTVNEQQFFIEKNLKNLPKRCHNCRVVSKAKRTGKIFDATSAVDCERCGVMTIVPFKPKGHKPVYCATCFAGVKNTPVHYPPLSNI
ncbi:MAG: zinc-ribbon domain containing protein [Cyanobacteria bacterium SZAS TMP-1]|nr:zinc-ribbon domain containing protein [Cyanobacteria bacterium SZAS TMP-1]